jgi:AcrR family transcriptional regulator
MSISNQAPSARRTDLLDKAYGYVLDHGLSDMSLRPLASAIGSSPRVLLFLFESKDGLIRALLQRARRDELDLLAGLDPASPTEVARALWRWLADNRHRQLLALWSEAYGRSLIAPNGPWAQFAEQTVRHWLHVLAETQSPARRGSRAGESERTTVLALLRGAMLDLLATGDADRVTAAVGVSLDQIEAAASCPRRSADGSTCRAPRKPESLWNP